MNVCQPSHNQSLLLLALSTPQFRIILCLSSVSLFWPTFPKIRFPGNYFPHIKQRNLNSKDYLELGSQIAG